MLYESKTFRLEADDQVLTLWLDFRGRPSHTLTLPIVHELSLLLDRVATLPADVLLIRSSSSESFLEEFDSAELARFTSPLEFAALARRGQDVVRKLAGLSIPTIAVIEGRCAGAGLEFALACGNRFAVDSPATRFEFPEVVRGLIPCWGGTYRLPRLIGMKSALSLLCGSRSLGAKGARQIGLVDQIAPAARIGIDLQTAVDRLRDKALRPRRPSFLRSLLNRLTPLRPVQAERVHRGDATPATAESELLIAVTSGCASEGDGLAAERAAIARLTGSDATRRLLELHRQAGAPVRVFPEPINPVQPLPKRVGIVGSGELAAFLASRLARRGHDVAFQHLATGLTTLRIDPAVNTTSEWVGFDNAELVIEAAAEDVGVKRNLFHQLEDRVRPRVPLVTASPVVLVDSIQAEMSRPNRIAGLCLPNPADVWPVAEVIGTASTDPGVIGSLVQWVRKWGFTPVRVGDRPGRLVDLIRMTYLAEGVTLVAEGLPIDQIDFGCRRFGMARGPLEWCDEIGLDRLAERAAHLQLSRGDGFARCLLFQRLLPYGCVGKAIGDGFYRYGLRRTPSRLARMVLWQDLDDDATAPYVFDLDAGLREGIDRLILRTVNEAARALADEPDADPATVDLALAYGMGWAPSRGGPLRYADSEGLSAIVDRLALYAERFGPRFAPCDELVRRAEAGESFYSGSAVLTETRAWRIAG
jgi:3-hydroxyacyl-CoA dehydrogenase / enoyl-CoA hydratase / 3-hydroxybutyryl-CoA epimerase